MLRVFHHYFSGRKLSFFLAETTAIAVAGTAGAMLLARTLAQPGSHAALRASWPFIVLVMVGFVVTFQFAMYLLDLYDLRVAGEDRSRGNRLLKAVGAAVVLMGLGMLFAPLRLPTGALLGGALGALAGTVAIRSAMRAVVGEPDRVLIVGNGQKGRSVARMIEEQGEDAFTVCALVEPPRHGEVATEPIEKMAARLNAAYVVMALDEPRGYKWVDALLQCRIQGRRVYDAAGFCERVLRRIPVVHLQPSSFAFSDELTQSPMRRFAKRAFDIAMSLLLLSQALPTMILIAIAIKLDSKGPIFYKQERVGAGGKPYPLYKFRSMRTDAEKDGAVWARANDDRVTRVGRFIRKTRMDETPQVINVLLGHMSFVGPRPERPVFVEQLKEQIPYYGLREAVKPGITGWAQIRYPYGASVEDARNKLEFDLYYVKNGSLFLDLAIIFHTVRHVLLGRGAR
jgi:sugar transferase (PEP-CTERM system associated)